MTDFSRSVSISKKFSSVNDGSTKHIYDGVFSSAPSSRAPKLNGSAVLPSRIEDYAEIFACSLSSTSAFASQGSSIPILDLPAVDRSRCGISGGDYSGVFGGDGVVDRIGLSYEELLRESKNKTAGREFPPLRVPVQTSAPPSKTQEFPVNSGGLGSSTGRSKHSSRSQEFPLKLWKNQAPIGHGNNLTSNATGTVPSKSQEFPLNTGNNQMRMSKHNLQKSTSLVTGPSKSQEEPPSNMMNTQIPIRTENGHTSTIPGTLPAKSREFTLNTVNNHMETGTDKNRTSISPGPRGTWSSKSQENILKTEDKQMSTSTGNGQTLSSPGTKPLKSQEFTSTSIDNGLPSKSQEFPPDVANNQKPESTTSNKPLDTSKHFNVSYNKINHLNTGDMTHVAELNAVSGYTCLSNEAAFNSKTHLAERSSSDADEAAFNSKIHLAERSSSDADDKMDADKKMKQGKHKRTISDFNINNQTSEHASGLRRGFSGPLEASSVSSLDHHSFGSSRSLRRLTSQKSKGALNKPRSEVHSSPPLLDEELDVNSEAAISAEAVKRAIEEAEVQIRLAKEILKGNIEMSFKDTLIVGDTSVKSSNEAYDLWKEKKVKTRSDNKCGYGVKGSPRDYEEHKVPRDRKKGNAANRLTEKLQENYVRSDDSIEKAVSSGSPISPATAEEVSWSTEQREPVNQNEETEMANGKFIHTELNLAQESTRQESGGGDWDAAKHLSQLFSGVKNRLVSFMSKQPETERKMQQMDLTNASGYPDPSVDNTQYMMKDLDAYKSETDREQLSEMDVQTSQPVATCLEAMEREEYLHRGGAGIKMPELEASKMKSASVVEQELVPEEVIQSPNAKNFNDELSDHPEPEVKKVEVHGLWINERDENLSYLDADKHNDMGSDPLEPESEAGASSVQESEMNEDGREHQNMADEVKNEYIQGELLASSLHKSVDAARLEHEKGQMDTVRIEELDKNLETASSVGRLDDGEVTSWDSSDDSVEEIEAEIVSKEADDSFHSIDEGSGLEAAVDVQECRLEEREIDAEDDTAIGLEEGDIAFEDDEACAGEESEMATVDDEAYEEEERENATENDEACTAEEREVSVENGKACKAEDVEISVENDTACKIEGRETAMDLQHNGDAETHERSAGSEGISEAAKDDEDACAGEENKKTEESPSEDLAGPSKVFHDSSKYIEHLAYPAACVSKLTGFSFFSRKKEASEQVDQSSEEARNAEVFCGDTEAMIKLNASHAEAADQISSAQGSDELTGEESEMTTASVLVEDSIDMDKTDDNIAPRVNFQVWPCENEQNTEQKHDDGKTKRLATDDSYENVDCKVEGESEADTGVTMAALDDNECEEVLGKEDDEYNIIEDDPVADIGLMGAGIGTKELDVVMGKEEGINIMVDDILETSTGGSGSDVYKCQHDVAVTKEEGKHNLETSPHRRRRWFQNREEAESSKQPSILVENEIVAEIDQEQKHTKESILHGCVEVHIDNSVDTTGESGAVLVDEGKNNSVEATHRRRRWFDNSQETGVPQKPILFDVIGTSKEKDQVVADESELKEHSQTNVTNADSERNETTDVREGDVLSAEKETKADMKASHRRKRWFENEEKVLAGQRATIQEVDNDATVEMEDESETRENSTKSKQSSETSTPTDTYGKLDPEDIRQQKETRETKNRDRERVKERIAVERVIREARERAFVDARERAERAAAEKANTGARVKAAADGRQGGSTSASSAEAMNKSIYEKASAEAKLRAERAAVERATAEARERAMQKAVSEKAANKDLKYQNSSPPGSSKASASEKSSGTINESPQRRKARLERNKRTMERAAKALEEKNMRDVVAQKEQAERNKFADALDLEVKRWSNGKEGNLRALLSTLQYVLGLDSGWQPTSLTELVSTTAVRKAYKRAALCVHPDKLQQRGATIQQKYVCEKVFDLLKEAWQKFNPDDR